jgi:translation elongation factor P/translation initiation factor 5A
MFRKNGGNKIWGTTECTSNGFNPQVIKRAAEYLSDKNKSFWFTTESTPEQYEKEMYKMLTMYMLVYKNVKGTCDRDKILKELFTHFNSSYENDENMSYIDEMRKKINFYDLVTVEEIQTFITTELKKSV